MQTRSLGKSGLLVSPIGFGAFKIGLGLLHGPGPGTIDALVRLDRPVFVDAKLHDIPSQVTAAADRLGRHGARWVTAHASGGEAMLQAAVQGLELGALHCPVRLPVRLSVIRPRVNMAVPRLWTY